MPDLEELRRVLRAREALAPDPAGIVTAARERGTRMRRIRVAGAVAGTAAAVVAVLTIGAAVLGDPEAARREPAGGATATAVPGGAGGWPAVPSYTGPAVPGSPAVPGVTEMPTAPVSGRSIDPIVPYRVTLPEGWREVEWWYEEGSFRGTWAGPDESVDLAVVNVLDPATRPASLLRPSGDPATGRPGDDGTLAWLADPRHFVRVQTQNDPPAEVLRSIVTTLRFTERPMIVPFRLGHLPAGLHLSGARIRFGSPQDDPDGWGPWWVTLTFDQGTGAARGSHDLEIDISKTLDPSSTPPAVNPTTVAGRTASVQRLAEDGATAITVFGVQGVNPSFVVGDAARARISVDEVGRIVGGLRLVADPEDTATWVPLELP